MYVLIHASHFRVNVNFIKEISSILCMYRSISQYNANIQKLINVNLRLISQSIQTMYASFFECSTITLSGCRSS
jgi:hypothetical protein